MYAGIKIASGHVTLTWIGGQRNEQEQKEIQKDVDKIKQLGPITFQFDEWVTLGKPDEIKQGNGKKARKCHVVDEKMNDVLQTFHRKWYFHEQGEDESRKERQLFHITVGKMSFEEIDKLDKVSSDQLFVKGLSV
jgi:hypothetical protein